jgi:DNA excision repair protein ERCC-2
VRIVRDCRPGDGESRLVEPELEAFEDQEARLRDFLSRYLESDAEIGRRDAVLRLSFYWSDFTAALAFARAAAADGKFFVTYRREGLKITCCDASAQLAERYDDYAHVVGFSATLKPFDFYSRLSGLASPELATAEFPSPFPGANRKLLVIPQLSSKFSARERNYPRIAEAIAKIASLRKGHYFAFFPSFEFLEQVAQRLLLPEGWEVVKQRRSLGRDEVEKVLERLRGPGQTLVLAVQGGVFSEGVDYPGEMAVGAFVVGAPLPVFDLEREEMRRYYERAYEAGFDYAYAFPAMAKAVQAAGRVIRSETDRGLIVLMDERFVEPNFARSMPKDWFVDSPRELVSGAILRDIKAFWGSPQKTEKTVC